MRKERIAIGLRVDARSNPTDATAALKFARQHKRLMVSMGKQILQLDLEETKPTDSELRRLIVGPSGKLRAPTLIVGTTLIVGFSPALYAKIERQKPKTTRS